MTTYGLLPTGFVLKPLDVIKAEIEAYQLANVSPALNVQPDSPIGQINGIVAAKIAELWEVAQSVYSSQYPDSASGVALDNVSSITGATRLPATKSAVTVVCSGTPATVLPAGRVLSVDPGGARFASVAGAVIGGGGTVSVVFEAEQLGAIIANAGTLTVIETPVSGWASATNADDAIVGREVETDEALRQRRIVLLELAGSATAEAIRSQIIEVDNVTEVVVFENDSEATVDTIPPHAIECLVRGGTDADIRAAIFASKSAGIQAFGSTTGTVVDTHGESHEIDFTRPTDEVLSVNIVVLTDPSKFPSTGAQMIKDSLAAFADAEYQIGDDVIRNKLFEACFRDFTTEAQAEIPGILDVTTLQIKFGGAFGTANLVVTSRQIATLDTSDITVTVTT